jgi:hypothetical protein
VRSHTVVPGPIGPGLWAISSSFGLEKDHSFGRCAGHPNVSSLPCKVSCKGEEQVVTTLPAPVASELEKLSDLPTEAALRRAVPFLAYLVKDPAFLDVYVLPLLEEAKGAEEWYVGHRCDAQVGSYSLQIFVWPLGTKTQIHDHSSWGAYCCAVGSVLEERYELPGRRLTAQPRPLEEGLAAVVERGGRGFNRVALR